MEVREVQKIAKGWRYHGQNLTIMVAVKSKVSFRVSSIHLHRGKSRVLPFWFQKGFIFNRYPWLKPIINTASSPNWFFKLSCEKLAKKQNLIMIITTCFVLEQRWISPLISSLVLCSCRSSTRFFKCTSNSKSRVAGA